MQPYFDDMPMKCVMMLFRFIKNRPEQDESGF